MNALTTYHAFVLAGAAYFGWASAKRLTQTFGTIGRNLGVYASLTVETLIGLFLNTEAWAVNRRDVIRAADWRWGRTWFVLLELREASLPFVRSNFSRLYTRIRIGRLVLEAYPNMPTAFQARQEARDLQAELGQYGIEPAPTLYVGVSGDHSYEASAEMFRRRAILGGVSRS